jgi:hypothetical protein
MNFCYLKFDVDVFKIFEVETFHFLKFNYLNVSHLFLPVLLPFKSFLLIKILNSSSFDLLNLYFLNCLMIIFHNIFMVFSFIEFDSIYLMISLNFVRYYCFSYLEEFNMKYLILFSFLVFQNF